MSAFDDAFIAAAHAMGLREITGDELTAATAARLLAAETAARFPFPQVTNEASPEQFVAALDAWRASMDPIESALRKHAIAARKVISSITDLMKCTADNPMLAGMHAAMADALRKAQICEMFVGYALRDVCRKGPGKKDYAVEVAAMQLYCKGVSKNRIALLLGKDRSDIRKYLTHMDELVDAMRWALDLDPDPPWGYCTTRHSPK